MGGVREGEGSVPSSKHTLLILIFSIGGYSIMTTNKKLPTKSIILKSWDILS
jgi:hypothetical protein